MAIMSHNHRLMLWRLRQISDTSDYLQAEIETGTYDMVEVDNELVRIKENVFDAIELSARIINRSFDPDLTQEQGHEQN